MESEILELKRLIEQLRHEDPGDLRVFGADGHEYRLGPTLSEETLRDFERRHKIALPEDYRLYLKLIGNGRWNAGRTNVSRISWRRQEQTTESIRFTMI